MDNNKRPRAGYKDTLNDYMGLVNQPTAADAIAEGFSNAARSPAEGPQQRMSNALLSGIGAGVKAAANRSRQEKLSPYLEQAGQIMATAAELETKVQQEELLNNNISQFFRQNTPAIMQLSRASLAGDTNATDTLAKSIYQNYRSLLNDGSLGAFDHYHNGSIYYENPETGNIEGTNIANLIYQAGIDPAQIFGHDALGVISAFSPGAKEQYENTRKAQALQFQGMAADIASKNAHTGVYNAQTDVYKTQAAQYKKELNTDPEEKAKQEMQQKIDEQLIALNLKKAEELEGQYYNNQEIIKTVEDLEKILSDSSLTGGSGLLRAVARAIGFNGAELNAQNAGHFYIEYLSENYPNLLEAERKMLMDGFASMDKNPEVSRQILKRFIEPFKKRNNRIGTKLKMITSNPKQNIYDPELYEGSDYNNSLPQDNNNFFQQFQATE